jgi:hypothetical protein
MGDIVAAELIAAAGLKGHALRDTRLEAREAQDAERTVARKDFQKAFGISPAQAGILLRSLEMPGGEHKRALHEREASMDALIQAGMYAPADVYAADLRATMRQEAAARVREAQADLARVPEAGPGDGEDGGPGVRSLNGVISALIEARNLRLAAPRRALCLTAKGRALAERVLAAGYDRSRCLFSDK